LYAWPAPNTETLAACADATVPRVVQMVEDEPVYMKTIDSRGTLIRGIEIPAGLPCGDVASRYYMTDFYWRSVTYQGVTGIALCY
jgi:hypothetical protein